MNAMTIEEYKAYSEEQTREWARITAAELEDQDVRAQIIHDSILAVPAPEDFDLIPLWSPLDQLDPDTGEYIAMGLFIPEVGVQSPFDNASPARSLPPVSPPPVSPLTSASSTPPHNGATDDDDVAMIDNEAVSEDDSPESSTADDEPPSEDESDGASAGNNGQGSGPVIPYHTATFPPGRTDPGFVPLGQRGIASLQQGNEWPLDIGLRGMIVHAEHDNNKSQPPHQRLSYSQIVDKYDQWDRRLNYRSTLRVDNRKYVIKGPKKRSRNSQLENSHLRALRRAVGKSSCQTKKGQPLWNKVRESVHAETGDFFGNAKLHKVWDEWQEDGAPEGFVGASDEEEHDNSGEEEEDSGEGKDSGEDAGEEEA